jgi:CubicO group peptidase (beta-lactamase class C family)
MTSTLSGCFAGLLRTILLTPLVAASAWAVELGGMEPFVDGYVATQMAEQGSPLGVVAIGSRDGTLLARGYGYRDLEAGEPLDAEEHLVRIGSVSKLFTWVAVMQLAEQGRLTLDRDVNEYLENLQIDDRFPGRPITLRHIMTHSTGFEDGGLGYLIERDPEQVLPLAEAMRRYEPERIAPPGEHGAYSNYAAALAGLIVQTVSGQPFAEYVAEHIFMPLGMNSSTFLEPPPEELVERMAKAYLLQAGQYVEQPFQYVGDPAPAGGMSATAADMLRFARAILNGGELNGQRILRRETVDEMLQTQFTQDARFPGMGLGFIAVPVNGATLWGHSGNIVTFHSNLLIDRENDLAIFTSFGAGGGGEINAAFPQLFYDRYFPLSRARPQPLESTDGGSARYAGSYLMWRANFSTMEKAMQVMGGLDLAPGPDNSLLLDLGPKGALRLVQVEPGLFEAAEPERATPLRRLAFLESDDGDVRGLVAEGIPFMEAYRAAFYQTKSFNLWLLGLAMLAFVGSWLRYVYGRQAYLALPTLDRRALRASLVLAATALGTFVVGGLVMALSAAALMHEIPALVKAWLWLPVLCAAAALYHLAWSLTVWRHACLEGSWARLRFTAVSVAGLALAWFFWFWNLYPFQYVAGT